MYLTGFADEASGNFDLQIKVTKELGWNHIESRAIQIVNPETGETESANLAFLSDEAFAAVEQKLNESSVKINCFGSGIANWSQSILDSPEHSYEEMRRAVPRMKKLGIPMVRIMSFAVPQEWKTRSRELESEVFKRVKTIVSMAEDAGILCVHENCMNWGGLSFEHTLRLLDAVNSPALKLVFDTGNPVFNDDYRGKPPYAKQSSWQFYENVRDHIAYVHIKDAVFRGGKPNYTYAGDGDGDVLKIVKDLVKRGYDGGISMEPHLGAVFHDPNAVQTEDDVRCAAYAEYGKRFMRLLKSAGGSF